MGQEGSQIALCRPWRHTGRLAGARVFARRQYATGVPYAGAVYRRLAEERAARHAAPSLGPLIMEAAIDVAGSEMNAEDPYRQENVRKGALHYLLGRGAAGVAGFAIVLLLVRFMDIANYAAYTA